MAINLLDLVKGQLNETVIGKASQLIGAKHSETSSAINTILPALMGAVVNKGSDKGGAGALLNMINSGNHDGSMFSNLAGLLGDKNATNGLMGTGKSLVSSLLGNKQNAILDLVTNATSLGRNSSSSLMSLLAPMVMGMIGKQVKSNGLDAGGLMKLLGSQRSIVESALPAGFNSALGLAADRVKASTSSPKREEKKGGGIWKILIPALLVMGLIALIGRSNCSGDVDRSKYASSYTVDATGNLVDSNGKIIKTAGEFKVVDGFYVDDQGVKIQRTLDAARDKMNNAADKTKEALQNTGDKIGDAAANAKDKLGDATANAKDKLGDVTANAKEAFDGAADKTKGALSNAGDKIGDAANKTKDVVTNAAGVTKEAATDQFNKLFNTKAVGTTYALSDIAFDPESHRITNMSKAEVEGLATALKSHPESRIQVQVHTADGANNIENKSISTLRAKVVKEMLVTLGVNAKQISFKGLSAKDEAKASANAVEVVVEQ